MTRILRVALTITSLLSLAMSLSVVDALAQEKHKVSYKASAENTKYTKQHTVDAGDTPGHEVRVFEIHRTYPTDAPVFNGIKLKETWTRGFSDYTDYNGVSTSYITYVFENGDKVFAHTTSMGQKNAAGKRATVSVGKITGGTGKFVGIQGLTRGRGLSDPKAGENMGETEVEFWFAK